MQSTRFGILLSARRDDGQSGADVLARTVSLARQAEALGLDDVWVTEHHFLDTVVSPSALTLTAYLLGATSQVNVGTAVTLLPLHSPTHVAEQAIMLDQVSGGRFALGVGRGQPLVEYELVGRGIERWRTGMSDALDETLTALGGRIEGHTDLTMSPEPRADGGPPVYMAANSESSVRMAAVRGLPMLMYFDKDTDAKVEMIAEYTRFGGPAADHAFAVYTAVTDSESEARALMRARARNMVDGANRSRHLIAVSHEPPTGVALEQMVDHVTDRLLATHPVGSAETCVERLVHDITRTGCTRVLCQVECPGQTTVAAAQLDRLAQEVLPEVRRRLEPSLVLTHTV